MTKPPQAKRSTPRPRTNYRLKAGDRVTLKQSARVDGYWFDAEFMPKGCRDKLYLLPGTTGTVIQPRTPCVTAGPSEPLYFANVDVDYMGEKHRVRVFHNTLRKELT